MPTKYFFLSLFFLLYSLNVIAQSDWKEVIIENACSIKFSSDLEIQNGKLLSAADSLMKTFEVPQSQLILQQSGLNEKLKSNETFVRVMVWVSNESQFGHLMNYKHAINLSESNSHELEQRFKAKTIESVSRISKFIKWHGLKVININGLNGLHVSYDRQLANNPVTLENIYVFYGDSKSYTIMTSYWKKDSKKWELVCDSILKTFKIRG